MLIFFMKGARSGPFSHFHLHQLHFLVHFGHFNPKILLKVSALRVTVFYLISYAAFSFVKMSLIIG